MIREQEKDVSPNQADDEIEPEDASEINGEEIKLALGDQLLEFFQKVKKKYHDKEAGWTPVKLETDSPETLAPIISELRDVLERAGAAHSDDLLSALLEFAQDEATKGSTKEDFLLSLITHKTMAPGAPIEKFYRKLAKGLQARQESERKAA